MHSIFQAEANLMNLLSMPFVNTDGVITDKAGRKCYGLQVPAIMSCGVYIMAGSVQLLINIH